MAFRVAASPAPPVEVPVLKAVAVQLVAPLLAPTTAGSTDASPTDPGRFRSQAGSGAKSTPIRPRRERVTTPLDDRTTINTPSRSKTDSSASGTEGDPGGQDGLYIRADEVWLAWVDERGLILAFAREIEPREVLRLENEQLRVSSPPAGYIRRSLQPGSAPGRMLRYLRAAANHWAVPQSQARLVVYYPPRDWYALRSLAETVPTKYRRWQFERGEFHLVPDKERQ